MENMGIDTTFWKNKRVLITGHTGFKGSWLSLWLQQIGAEVFGYSLDPPTAPSLFSLAQVNREMTSIIGDVRDKDNLLKVMKEAKPEIIIHMAAQPLVRMSYVDPVETFDINVMGTVHLLEAIRKLDCAKVVINVTTDKCYENKEWVWGYRENEPMGGFDPYSTSKACSELVTSAFRSSFFNPEQYQQHGVAIASARAGNVIGGGDWGKDRIIPDCMKQWLEKGTVNLRYPKAIRPWQHVLEPLQGYLMLAEKLYDQGNRFSEAFNFGPNDSEAKPVQFLVEHMALLWGNDARWTIDEQEQLHEAHYLKLDCSKANMKLGWKPKWNLEKTLEAIVDWYRVYQESPESIRENTLSQIDSYSKY